MNKQTACGMLLIGATLTGCANMTESQRGTGTGAGLGAAAGAALGAIAGGGKGAAIGAAVGAAAGAGGGYLWSQRMQEQKQAMLVATQGTGVAVTQTADNQLKLEIPSDISFETGKAEINPSLRPVLDKFSETLQANPVTTIRIIGHTDSVGSDATNDPLSIRRAASVRDYFAARGLATNRIAIAGRGSHEPVAANTSATGRAQNRRVEIFVAQAGAVSGAPAALNNDLARLGR